MRRTCGRCGRARRVRAHARARAGASCGRCVAELRRAWRRAGACGRTCGRCAHVRARAGARVWRVRAQAGAVRAHGAGAAGARGGRLQWRTQGAAHTHTHTHPKYRHERLAEGPDSIQDPLLPLPPPRHLPEDLCPRLGVRDNYPSPALSSDQRRAWRNPETGQDSNQTPAPQPDLGLGGQRALPSTTTPRDTVWGPLLSGRSSLTWPAEPAGPTL